MSTAKFEQPLYKVYESNYGPQPIIVDESIESPETLTIRLEEEAAARESGGLRSESPSGLPLPGLDMSAYKQQPSQLHGFADSPYSQYSPQSSYLSQPSENGASQMNQMAFAANSATGAAYISSGVAIQVLSCHPNVGSYGMPVSLKVSCQYDIANMTASAPQAYILFDSHRCKAHLKREAQDANGGFTYTVTADAPDPRFIQGSGASLSNIPLTLIVENANNEELARADNAGVFAYHDAPCSGNGGGGVGGNGSSAQSGSVGLGGPSDSETTHGSLQGGTGRKSSNSPDHRTSPAPSLAVDRLDLPVRTSTTTPSSSHHSHISAATGAAGGAGGPDSSTNTYGYPPSAVSDAAHAAHVQAQVQAQSNFAAAQAASAAGAYNPGGSNMLGAYRSTSYTDHYSRAPPALRSPHGIGGGGAGGWAAYGSPLDPLRGAPTAITHATHTSVTRPSLTALPHPTSGAPQLVRTSTINQPAGAGSVPGTGFNPYAMYPAKATLKVLGDLDTMAENWTHEEWGNKRRIVLFKKQQQGSQLTTSFRPVSVTERPPQSICISCIWWQEKQECFVTSVDTIHLLEQLVAAPARFTVEEKNRIRRNLEGFHPLTVSKAKHESEEFFKVIMAFGNPKPRNIEKDVKVFPWKILGQALKKIISKYSASPSSTTPMPHTPTQLLTPVSVSGSYPPLPPAPGAPTTATDTVHASGYVGMGVGVGVGVSHHAAEGVSSPRSLSGSTGSWGAYAGSSTRTLSPGLKTSSPTPGSALRISTIPASYDSRTSAYGIPTPTHHSHSHSPHHHSQQHTYAQPPGAQGHGRAWDSSGYGAVADAYSNHASHAHAHHSQVYGAGAYGEGAPRA